jgi:DNA-directed RNA polymerase subunit RPC12/RpoP
MCELLVGLDGMDVLAVEERGELLLVGVESKARAVGCPSCGSRAKVKDRPVVELGDLRSFGRPVVLAWHKRRWCCPDADCPAGSWTEVDERVAAPRCGLTRRAGLWGLRAGRPPGPGGLRRGRGAGLFVVGGDVGGDRVGDAAGRRSRPHRRGGDAGSCV